MFTELRTPDGEIFNLDSFETERQAVKALGPHFQLIKQKYPYASNRRLTDEELALFELRLLVQKWFCVEHKTVLASLVVENINTLTSDWVDDAEVSMDQLVKGSLLNQKNTLLKSIEAALFRCRNKTYAIDAAGNLIDLERLWVVPHSSQSIDEKKRQN